MRREGLTQAEVARRAGVSQATVSRACTKATVRTSAAQRRLTVWVRAANSRDSSVPAAIQDAVERTWDGSDLHAIALADLINTSRRLWPGLSEKMAE